MTSQTAAQQQQQQHEGLPVLTGVCPCDCLAGTTTQLHLRGSNLHRPDVHLTVVGPWCQSSSRWRGEWRRW